MIQLVKVRPKVCACGHHRRLHYYDNTNPTRVGDGVGRCHASVMVEVPMGVTVTICKCKQFRERAA